MDWLQASDYWLARWVFERLLAAIYLLGFLTAATQFPALLGEHGLLPAPRFLGLATFRETPAGCTVGTGSRVATLLYDRATRTPAGTSATELIAIHFIAAPAVHWNKPLLAAAIDEAAPALVVTAAPTMPRPAKIR